VPSTGFAATRFEIVFSIGMMLLAANPIARSCVAACCTLTNVNGVWAARSNSSLMSWCALSAEPSSVVNAMVLFSFIALNASPAEIVAETVCLIAL
jgi:hypothetical protein